MVIAVETGLDTVKKELVSRGFSVVDLESGLPFDAAVYLNRGILDIPTQSVRLTSALDPAGTLLVSARGRTPQEIAAILSQKAYGNLF